MEIKELMKKLKDNNIDISLNNESIVINSDNAALPAALLEEIRQEKAAIIAYLRNKIIPVTEDTLIRPATPGLDRYPASPAQQSLYFLQQLAKESTAYNLPMVHYLGAEIDKVKLFRAFRQLLDRHESLNTAFLFEDGLVFQRVREQMDFEIEEHSCNPEEFAGFLKNYIRPFDLSGPALLRSSLVKVAGMGYVWVIDIHHIITDGMSQQILMDDFFHFYNGGKLPPLRIQYKDFSVWQNEADGRALLDRQKKYWSSVLSGPLPVLDLAPDHQRPAFFTFRGSNYKFSLGAALTGKISDFNKKHKSTLQMTFLAVLNVLYHKYSGAGDIIIGCGIAGRNYPGLERVAGMFVNTLALRNKPDAAQSFLAFHSEVMEHCILAYENQDIQFEEVVGTLDVDRNPSRNPVFDIALMMQNFGHSNGYKEQLPGAGTEHPLARQIASYDPGTAKFDMAWFVTPGAQDININIQYYTAIFEEATIRRLAGHLQHIFEVVLNDPSLLLSDIDLAGNKEAEQIRIEFSTGAPLMLQPEGKYKTILDLFEERVAESPDSIAVVFEGTTMSYRELDERSGRLGFYLRSLGVKKESLVPVCMERSPGMIIGLLGILKAGGAYVPIDPEYPPDRIRYILQDTAASFIVTTLALARILPQDSGIGIVTLDGDSDKINNYPVGALTPDIDLEQLAYVIYTSGSTGKPKGVMVEHGTLCARLAWGQQYFQLQKDDVVLQKTAFTFDVSVWEIFWPVTVGAKLVFAVPGGHKDPAYLRRLIEAEQITTIHFVPSMLSAFLPDVKTGECSSLRRVLCSGEALKVPQVTLFREKLGDLSLSNLYGPTEATIEVSCWQVPPVTDKVSIGRPMPGTSLYILDDKKKIQPVGVSGELYIGGAQVARGYLNQPELTAMQFMPDPYRRKGRMYRTGDICRWLPDGNIEFLGRKDDQIKVRGYRIELGEIEKVLSGHAAIETTVVLANHMPDDNYELHAFFTAEVPLVAAELKTYLKQALPFYMIPQTLTQVPAIPFTLNGKVDKPGLLAKIPGPEHGSRPFVAPDTVTGQKLVEMWQQLLHRDRISVEDNFFDIGGHSLKAMKLLSDINKVFDVELSLEMFFTNPTIAFVAWQIDRINWAATEITEDDETDRFLI